MDNKDLYSGYFKLAKDPKKAEQKFDRLARKAGVPDNWRDPDSGYNIHTVSQQINNFYGVDLFSGASNQE